MDLGSKFTETLNFSDGGSDSSLEECSIELPFTTDDYRGKIIVDDDLPYYLFIKNEVKKVGLLVLNDDLTAEFEEPESDLYNCILKNEHLLIRDNKKLESEDFIEFCYNEIYSSNPTFKFLASDFDSEEDELDYIEDIIEYAKKTKQKDKSKAHNGRII